MVHGKKLALITRPYIDAKQFEEDLLQIGIESFVEPLLKISYYPSASKIIRPYLDSCQALVATSANAVRAIGYNKKTIITVGAKTAGVAKEMGFEKIYSADNDVDALEKYIEEIFSPQSGGLLYISSDVISKEFHPTGFKTTRVVVYNSLPAENLSNKCKKYLENKQLDYVFLFSKRTADVLSNLAGEYDFKDTLCICLSDSIKEAISDMSFKDVFVTKKLDKETLLELAKK